MSTIPYFRSVDKLLNGSLEKLGDNNAKIREGIEQLLLLMGRVPNIGIALIIGMQKVSLVLLNTPVKGKLAGAKHLNQRIIVLC